ncbi:hypothetical protein [Thermodesulfovibrio hydrogeniphilus]
MTKTYPLNHYANKNKIEKVIYTLKAYIQTAQDLANYQWFLFFTTMQFNKNANTKHIQSSLSERYKQTCQYQVVSVLKSYISNRQNDFVEVVVNSSLSNDIKRKLLLINAYKFWFAKGEFSLVKTRITVTESELKLARKIFKHIMKKHRKPSFSHINMQLDSKVALIKEKEPDKAKEFDYWIRLSTIQKGNPIYIPLKSNSYWESIKGKRKNFCQINLDRHGN